MDFWDVLFTNLESLHPNIKHIILNIIFSTIARLENLHCRTQHKAAAYAGHAHYLIAATAPGLLVVRGPQCRCPFPIG